MTVANGAQAYYANNQERFHHIYSFEIVEFAIMLLLGGKQIVIRHWWKDGSKISRVRIKQVFQQSNADFFGIGQTYDVFQYKTIQFWIGEV